MTKLRTVIVTVSLPWLLGAAPPTPDRQPINVVGHAWAPFISPMGEPFRPRDATDDTLARWFNQADSNHDGQLTPPEMQADALRFFATLDTDNDGEITPEELVNYEWELAPDIQLSSRLKRRPGEVGSTKPAEPNDLAATLRRERLGRSEPDWLSSGLQGAARYSLLNMPEPVAAADADFNRGISRAEFAKAALDRFNLLDRDHRGALTLAALDAMWTDVLAKVHNRKKRSDKVDQRVAVPVPLDR